MTKSVKNKLRIGTRGSSLALAQTHRIAAKLDDIFELEIRIIRTEGDQNRKVALRDADTTGLFTRAIESSLVSGEIDLAVHSLKDLPLESPPELSLVAIPQREDTSDLLIIAHNAYDRAAAELPIKSNSKVGTSSPRREAQLRNVRNDVVIAPIRGNINTRLEKLKSGKYDAIILAAAGVNRLGLDLQSVQVHRLPLLSFIPAPGQGALAIQMRSDSKFTETVREVINDPVTEISVMGERKLLKLFGGGCSMPLGALILPKNDGFQLYGFWSDGDISKAKIVSSKDINADIVMLHNELTKQK